MMKKKILALVICALGISTIGAFAQTEKKESCKAKTECCKEHKGKKFAGKGDKKKGHAKMNPFEGIELAADQQQKISDLRAQQKTNKEAEKKAAKESRKKAREEFNTQLATILTPEQMAAYNANCDTIRAKKQHFSAKERQQKRQKHEKK